MPTCNGKFSLYYSPCFRDFFPLHNFPDIRDDSFANQQPSQQHDMKHQLSLLISLAMTLAIEDAHALPSKCLHEAAQVFGHDAKLLYAISLVESGGNCTAISKPNANGSYDIGCMQINSAWLPTLSTRFGITERHLLDPCTNIAVGAWVLAHNKRRLGDTWRAVGAYNAATESKRKNYSWKVHDKLAALPPSQ